MSGKPWDLRVGDWRTALADVAMVDAVICDPPFGVRTHQGHNSATGQILSATGQRTRTEIGYKHWTPQDVQEFVAHWSPRCAGWMACMTSDDLIPVWRDAYAAAGRLDFAPVTCLTYHPRLLGDGPSSCTIYLMVARPRDARSAKWGCLPGWYGPFYPHHNQADGSYIGGKPVRLMRQIVRDYSRPGDLVCDPCAGGGTTLLAACKEGRTAIGAELDPTTALRAVKRLLHADLTPPLFADIERDQPQANLPL